MKARMFEFFVASTYDEREIEELFETLEMRGAIYEHKIGSAYRLYVPAELDPTPFRETLWDSPSIAGTGTTIYETEYVRSEKYHVARF